MPRRILKVGHLIYWSGLVSHFFLWFFGARDFDDPRAYVAFAAMVPFAAFFWWTLFCFRGAYISGTATSLTVHEHAFRKHKFTGPDLHRLRLEITATKPDGSIELLDNESLKLVKPRDTLEIQVLDPHGRSIRLLSGKSSVYSLEGSIDRFEDWKASLSGQ